MKPIAALTLLSFFSPSASADVNMLDASFRQTFIDASVNGLKIERRYDSRSTFMGLFGFGWCSTFDTKLDTHTLKTVECGKPSSQPVHYMNGTYAQDLPTGLTRIYDADSGALIRLKSKRGETVEIDGPTLARRRLPRAAALGEGKKLRLEFDQRNENVIALILPDLTRLTFAYSEKRDLTDATNAWSNTYRFNYDRLHNLASVKYPDGTEELIEYDSDRDRLTKFQGRDGCTETYEHTFSSSAREKTQISTALLSCNGKTKRTATFRFGFIRKGNSYLLNSFERGTK